MNYDKLNNPVWHSLNEVHKKFCVGNDNVKFYRPKYSPFGSFTNYNTIDIYIDKYADLTPIFFVVGEKPMISDNIHLIKQMICEQMILDKEVTIDIEENIVELNTEKHKLDLYNLVNLVQPGYFMKNTIAMGSYFGIYKNNQLVAVAGERLKMNEFTEISAVVTHPNHTGKGFAKQLIAYTINHIVNGCKTPYLHVLETNFKAINLYQKLGFTIQRKMNFWKLKKSTLQ